MPDRRCVLALLALSLAGPASAQGRDAMIAQMCASPAVVRSAFLAQLPAHDRPYVESDFNEHCPHAHLPAAPVHDTADAEPDATHTHWTYAVAYSADGKLIASGGFDRTVKLWDAATGRLVRTLTRFENTQPDRNPRLGFVRGLAFLADGKRIIVNADGHPLRTIWIDRDEAGNMPAAPPPRGGVLGMLTTGNTGDDQYRWNMALSAKGLLFVTRGDRASVDTLDAESLASKFRLAVPLRQSISIAVSDAAGLVATGVEQMTAGDRKLDARVVLWRIDGGEKVAEFATGRTPQAIAFSGDGKVLAVAVDDGAVHVFSVPDRKQIQALKISKYSAQALALTRDGTRLMTCGTHPQLWDVASGELVRHFGPFTDGCHSVSFDPQERFAVTTSMGSDLRVWEIATGTFHRRLGRNVKPPR